MEKLNVEQSKEFRKKVVESLVANKKYRAGQAMFNVLYETHPTLANSIRGTEADPFHNNKHISNFLNQTTEVQAIYEVWGDIIRG